MSLISWHQYHIMWYFLVIFNTKIIKSTKIMITHIIVVIIILGSVICAKRRFWRPKKVVQLARIGGRGGEEIWAPSWSLASSLVVSHHLDDHCLYLCLSSYFSIQTPEKYSTAKFYIIGTHHDHHHHHRRRRLFLAALRNVCFVVE